MFFFIFSHIRDVIKKKSWHYVHKIINLTWFEFGWFHIQSNLVSRQMPLQLLFLSQSLSDRLHKQTWRSCGRDERSQAVESVSMLVFPAFMELNAPWILQGETWKEKYFNAHIPPRSTLNTRSFCFAIPAQCLLTTWTWFSFGCDGGLLSSTVAFQQEDSEFKPWFGKFSVEFACSACACVVIPPKDMLVGYIGILAVDVA